MGPPKNWPYTRKDHISDDHITGTECNCISCPMAWENRKCLRFSRRNLSFSHKLHPAYARKKEEGHFGNEKKYKGCNTDFCDWPKGGIIMDDGHFLKVFVSSTFIRPFIRPLKRPRHLTARTGAGRLTWISSRRRRKPYCAQICIMQKQNLGPLSHITLGPPPSVA